MKNNLYNLSQFATAYAKENGAPAYGLAIAGYRDDGDGYNEYTNIWVPSGRILSKRKMPNGHIAVTLEFSEIDVKTKNSPGPEKTADKKPAGKKPAGKKPALQECDDDSDIPF